jgi:hypothetical protein
MLDHIIAHSITGRYTPMPDLPVIDHPVILADGMHFYCLSTSPAADGTRATDWYALSFAGVYPICNCKAWRRETGCKHCDLVAAQLDDLCQARTARWAAEHAARRQEGRAA